MCKGNLSLCKDRTVKSLQGSAVKKFIQTHILVTIPNYLDPKVPVRSDITQRRRSGEHKCSGTEYKFWFGFAVLLPCYSLFFSAFKVMVPISAAARDLTRKTMSPGAGSLSCQMRYHGIDRHIGSQLDSCCHCRQGDVETYAPDTTESSATLVILSWSSCPITHSRSTLRSDLDPHLHGQQSSAPPS